MVQRTVGGLGACFAAMLLAMATVHTNSTAQCTDRMLLDNTAELLRYGIDSTGHWWAITKPYSQRVGVVIDSVVQGSYEDATAPLFNFDGTKWAFTSVLADQWYIVTSDSAFRTTTARPRIMFPSQGHDLWWVERNGTDWLLTNGSRGYQSINNITDAALHPLGMVVAWLERLPASVVLMQNGKEIARGDDILLGGILMSGECVYAIRSGEQWEVRIGISSQASQLSRVASLQVNPMGTMAAWIAHRSGLPARVQIYSPDFIEPWESPQLASVGDTVVMSPFDALVAYKATIANSSAIGFNGAAYPCGVTCGTPTFSHDGKTMAYASYHIDNYVYVNGKRYRVDAKVPMSGPLLVSPSGESVSWSSSTTLVVVDLTMERMQMGKMCDRVTDPIYDRSTDTYRCLGDVNGRLYLLQCKAR